LSSNTARVKQLGRCYGARKVVVACLGDFLNSDRRLDELLSNATNRSKATLLAVDILYIDGLAGAHAARAGPDHRGRR
jgi:hypothetical protein